jgi:type I restriction enzyme, S subunit
MKREDFPAVWTIVRVKEIAQILYGEALQSEFRVDTGNILVYGSSGIIGKHNKSLREGPSIIIGRKGNVGSVYYVNQPFWCIDTAFYLDNISETVDIEFLAHALQIANLVQFTKSVAVPGIGRGDIENALIPLPPLPEQRRITAILREADEIRKLRRRANEKTQEIVSALFYDMFGDPATNTKGWRMEKLGDLIAFATSGPRNWAMYYTPQGAKFIRVQNLTNHKLNFGNMVFITPPNTLEAKRSKVVPNDVLFSITGVVGLVAIVPEGINDAYVSQHVAIVRLKPDVDPHFIVAFLAHKAGGQAQISLQQYGQTKPGFGLSDIRSINVFVPPYSLQKQFTEKLADINMLGSTLDKSYSGLDTLHQSLLARAFTGELTTIWSEQHAEELAQAARERDHLLAQLRLVPAELVTPVQPGRSEISERQELLAMFNDVQRALLAMLDEQPATYYTSNNAHEELVAIECSFDVVRRELHFLAAAGWIKEQSLPAEGETGVRYIPVYRSLLPDDHSQQPDIEQLIERLGSEYPDEVLV